MTETGNTVERLREVVRLRKLDRDKWFSVRTADVDALLAVVEAAQAVAENANALTLRLLDEALARLHTQASDEGAPVD